MKSSATSPPTEFVTTLFWLVRIHSGPTPNINSALRDKVQGFLKRRSVSHSDEWRVKNGVTPASISNQFSIGVNSTATVGPKLHPPPLTLSEGAAPISRMAADSLPVDCAKALAAQSKIDAIRKGVTARTMSSRRIECSSSISPTGCTKSRAWLSRCRFKWAEWGRFELR